MAERSDTLVAFLHLSKYIKQTLRGLAGGFRARR